MDTRIGPSLTPLGNATTAAVAQAARAALAARQAAQVPGAGAQAGFAEALGSALRTVSASQQRAGALQREVVAGSPTASVEETMIAMQKAQLSFQSALHVRNRMVQAYTDIMNMQV